MLQIGTQIAKMRTRDLVEQWCQPNLPTISRSCQVQGTEKVAQNGWQDRPNGMESIRDKVN